MTQIYDGPKKRIKQEILSAEHAVLNGRFKDYTEAKLLVERRLSLLKALDILNEQVDLGDDDADS